MNYFDLHCDTVYECSTKGKALYDNDLQLSLKKGEGFDAWVQTFAFWIDDRFRGEDAYREFLRECAFFTEALEQEERLHLYDPQKPMLTGHCYAIPSVEGGAALGGKLSRVQEFSHMGIKLMTLTGTGDNELAGGALGSSGLTELGKQAVAEMERLRMLVDVSHLNDQSFWQVERAAKRPFVASHSNARSVCGHRRNLTDDMIRAISERGGLIGLNFYVDFLSDDKQANFAQMLRHMEHILALGGEGVLAVGSDFDGAALPGCINSVEKIEKLGQVMVQYFGEPLAGRILFDNARAFYQKFVF